MLLIHEKDGSIRITANYKHLNSVSIIGKYPLPCINEVLGSLGTTEVFSTFERMSGFVQNAVDSESIGLMAFVILRGLYHWLRMTQGHIATPSAFARLMQRVTKDQDRVYMHLDDAIAHDANPRQHINTVHSTFPHLEEHNLDLAPCERFLLRALGVWI